MLSRFFILVAVASSVAHAQVGPDPEWNDEPAADTPSAQAEPVVQAEPPAAPVIAEQPAIESRSLGSPAVGAATRPTEPPSGVVSGTFLPLALVVGLIVVLAALARGFMKSRGGLVGSLGAGGRAPSGVLEVLGRYPVARGSTLVLLKIDRRVLLLAQTRAGKLGGASFTTLSEITDAEEVAGILLKTRDEADESMSKRFTSLLGAFERQQPAVDITTTARVHQRPPRAATSPGSAPLETRVHESHGPIGSIRQRLDAMRKDGGGSGSVGGAAE